MYQGLPLSRLHICEEIKADMRAPPAGMLAGSPHVACLVPRAAVGRRGVGVRGEIARRMLAAKVAASDVLFGEASRGAAAAAAARPPPALVWLAWAADDASTSVYELSLVHRRQPVALLPPPQPQPGGGEAAAPTPPPPAAAGSSSADARGAATSGEGREGDAPPPTPPPTNADNDDDDSSCGGASDGSGSDSELVHDPAALAARVAAAVATGRGMDGVRVHGRAPEAPFTLGSEWTETQFTACSDDDDDGDDSDGGDGDGGSGDGGAEAAGRGGRRRRARAALAVYRTAEYHFRELVWAAPAAASVNNGGGAGSAPAQAGVGPEDAVTRLARQLVAAVPHAPPAAAAPPEEDEVVVLLDLPRNIALAFAPRDGAAFISSSGVHGVWQRFGAGRWAAAC